MANEVDIKVTASGGSRAAGEIDKAQNAGQQLQQRISGIGSTARGLLAADFITQIGESAKNSFGSATRAASDLGESMNAVDRIFGDAADDIHEFGRESANAFGLSERAFNQLATPLGASLKNVGLGMDQVAELTLKLTKRAADMASVFNTDVSVALEDIQAALRGESDPIEKFGVSMNEAAVTAEALATSGKKVATELTLQDKALARVNLIMKQTEAVAGDFAATSDGLANSQRIANAEIEEAKAKLGQGLLPVLADGAQVVGKLAEGFAALPGPIQTTAAVVLGLGAAFVFLAPKIIAARDAWREMDLSFTKSETRMGRVISGVTATAGKLAVLATVANIAGQAFGSGLNPQLEELAENLAELEPKGKAGGEAARLMGEDLDKLDKSLRAVALPGTWHDIERGTAKVIEGVSGIGDVFDDTFTHDIERVKALDSALAHLVSTGRAVEAQRILEEASKRTGIAIDDLRKALPEYAAAQAKAGRETKETSAALEGQIVLLEDLENALRAQSDPIFALIEAQNDLAEAQHAYNDAVREHGRNSPEAAEALRNMTAAAIALSGAAANAQGVFNGELTPAMKQVLIQAGFTKEMIAQLEQQFKAAALAGENFARTYTATIKINVKDQSGGRYARYYDEDDRQGRAHGGYASGMVEVHEGEVVDFEGRRVYNAQESRPMLGAQAMGGMWSGGGTQALDVNVNVNVNGSNREFVQFIKAIVDTEGGGDVVKAFSRAQFQNR